MSQPLAEAMEPPRIWSERVVVYTHKKPEQLLEKLRGQRIHRMEELELYALDGAFLEDLAATLGRVNTWSVMRNDGSLFLTVGEVSVTCDVLALPLSP